jgi:hypothetical protein
MSTGLFSDEEDGYNLEEEVKYKLKVGTPSAPPLDVSDKPISEPSGDEEIDLSFGDEGEAKSDDKPFDDTPFDAGVEADEETDPEKFIQQLSGKLGTSLRKYTEEKGEPDFDLEKFAINSVISATNTAEMDEEDQKDIIKKIKSSGNKEKEVNVDVNVDTGDGGEDEENTSSDGEDLDMSFDDEENLDEASSLYEPDPKFASDPGFAPKADNQMWESDDLLSDAVMFGNDFEVTEGEYGENELKNAMFFNDVFNIYNSVSELLSACDETIDELLSDGHAWAVEHLTTATTNMQNIHQFLKGNEALFNEVRETQNYTFFQDLKTLRRICFDILNMDVEYLDNIINEHHDWIPNLAAKSLTHVIDVYDFMYEYVIGGEEWSRPMEVDPSVVVSDELAYHLNNEISLGECVFRYGSEKYLSLIKEVKTLHTNNLIKLNENDKIIVEDFTGESIKVNGEVKLLEFIEEVLDFEELNESDKFKGKKSSSPNRDSSGGKAYKVYVPGCSAKTENNPRGIKLIRFGSGGLKAKLSDSDAKKRYDSRHGCSKGKHNDKCKAGYWSCRLPRYAKKLGLSGGGKWW